MDAREFNTLLRFIDTGDESALARIYAEYGKKIKWVAYNLTKDWQHSEAILNDVLVILWNKSHKFKSIKNPNACIYDLAKKASINYYRKYLKKQKKETPLSQVLASESETNLLHIEEYSNLYFMDMISQLNLLEQEIIVLKIAFGYTHAQISDKLKMSEGTVKWKYQQILQKLRKEISEENDST